ncbi:MAG: hypothetical protein ACTIJ9_07300 [Aequorivita sp.]
MKNLFFVAIFMFCLPALAQDIKATTAVGKTVILKTDNTWSYFDQDASKKKSCNLGPDFKEGKVNKGLRVYAAIENDCKEEDVIFINTYEDMGSGIFSLCVKGVPMKYKKVGTVFFKSDNTWSDSSKNKICNLGSDFKEGEVNKRLREYVAVENDCKEEDVLFINSYEDRGSGMFSLCVKGRLMKYKKIGTVFSRADYTPSYSDQNNSDNNICTLGSSFKEGKVNKKLREHVAIENDCEEEDVVFLKSDENLGSGIFSLCVKGKPMKYIKVGTVFMHADEDPMAIK